MLADDTREWLEADGLGGFTSGTVSGIRTRRYHALLLIATTPPTGRMVLVNGFDAWVEYAGRRIPISSQRYVPGIVHPDGASKIESFTADPWPAWNYQVSSGLRIGQEIVVPHERAAVAVVWRLVESPGDDVPIRVVVRPFLSGRDYHSTHHENSACSTTAITSGDAVTWQPYDSVPAVISRTNADYTHEPDWYRQFLYSAEQARGLDALEDLLAPGWLTFDLRKGQALWLLQSGPSAVDDATPLAEAVSRLRDDEQTRRAAFASPLHRAADAYLVKRGDGRTIIAGYPWFTDWGRDTFFALRGLCLDTARVDEACNVLLTWSAALSDGMLPNRFPIVARGRSSTRSTRRCGSSSLSTVCARSSTVVKERSARQHGRRCWTPHARFWTLASAALDSGSGPIRTGCWPAVNRAWRSRGWTHALTAGPSRPGLGSRSKSRRYG